MPFERHQRSHRDAKLAQLVGAAELRQVDDEASGQHLGADLAQQLHRPFGGAAGRDQVVDLGHMLFDRFFAVMREIEFAIEAERRTVVPIVLFAADADERARRAFAMLNDHFPSLLLVPVFNQGIPQITRYREHFPLTRSGGPLVSIPALTAVVRSVVDRRGFSFATYSTRTADTTTELYDWMRRVFVTFRELEVRLLLSKLKADLKRSA